LAIVQRQLLNRGLKYIANISSANFEDFVVEVVSLQRVDMGTFCNARKF